MGQPALEPLAGSEGQLVVSGRTTNRDASTFRAVDGITIGGSGHGQLHVDKGARVSTEGAILGNEEGGRGTVTVEGNGNTDATFWYAGLLNVKRGDVVVNRGSLLRTTAATIAGNATSSVTVSGAGTGLRAGHWESYGSTTIGNSANGTLNIEHGGKVTAANATVGRFAGSVGRINVSSSDSDVTSQWLQEGNLNLGGSTSGGVGHLNLNTNSFALIEGTTTIYGTSSIVMGPGSQLVAPTIDNSHGGFFDFLRGKLNTREFTGDLLNQAGTLGPYQSNSREGTGAGDAIIRGNYTQQVGATLAIDLIDDSGCGIGYDHLRVMGDATLGGTLELTLFDGFVPSPSSVFNIVASETLFGEFANASPGERVVTTDGRGSFLVSYGSTSPFNANSVFLSNYLSLAGTLLGDFNDDGLLDATDIDMLTARCRRS